MIQFKLYSKSPKDMTDKEAKEAKYRDTSKPRFIKPAAKVGAAAGAISGLKKSIGRKGLIKTAISTGWGAAKGAAAGAGVGAAADIGTGLLGYSGRKVAKTTKNAVESVKNEAKKFSKINDTPEKRAGLVAAGTATGAGVGGLYGMNNRSKAISSGIKDIKSAVKEAAKGDKMKALRDVSKSTLTSIKNNPNAMKGFKLGARVGGIAALAGGLKLTADMKRKQNQEYNKELKGRKRQIGK